MRNLLWKTSYHYFFEQLLTIRLKVQIFTKLDYCSIRQILTFKNTYFCYHFRFDID